MSKRYIVNIENTSSVDDKKDSQGIAHDTSLTHVFDVDPRIMNYSANNIDENIEHNMKGTDHINAMRSLASSTDISRNKIKIYGNPWT